VSRKPRVQKKVDAPAPRRSSRDVPLAVAGALGVVLTTGLLVIAMTRSSLPYCGAGSGCDIVQSSRWSTLLGLPITAWGLGVYVVLMGAGLFATRKTARWRIAILFATVGFGVSLYLNAISIWVIEAVCFYCLGSLVLLTAIYLLTWRADGLQGLGGWRFGSSVTAALVLGFMSLHYAGVFDPAAGPEDPYLRDLAEHLRATEAKFYGAYWCPHCQQQKLVFGASSGRLPYIECSPNGRRGAPATSCLAAGIYNYPTWVIDGRRLERTLSARQLARYSGFRAPASNRRSLEKNARDRP
jgi:uncharacterized membrane protein